MAITREEATAILGQGTTPPMLALARLVDELYDRLEALEAGTSLVLPEADPLVAGALWSNVGIVTVSAGA